MRNLWYVDFEDLSCAWSTRNKARDYVKGEIERLSEIDSKWKKVKHENYGSWEEWIHPDLPDYRITIAELIVDQKPYR